ncbi:SDR family NAD(P)-dependent oxidoreductase [Sandaracinus amylolyticus]|uniref:SDR family NAD(P)-dependent oxidoreductase n=1 Tax=Sandaracinus amylolyticus TaxID=927083 RepID=UPI00069DED38|nr:SDR family NAD(P)-dependent oxidoreductase [Sandaracinus amylolyticus]
MSNEGEQKVALITGASSGLGRAIAERLAQSGWIAGLVARRRDRLEALARDIETRGGRAHVIVGDLRDRAFAAEVVDALVARTGRLDLLVNNAGAPTPAIDRGTWEVATDDAFDDAFALNVRAMYRLSHDALPHLRATRGSIVNVGSAGVAANLPIDLVYLASKGAVEVMSQGMARKWAPLGVRVNVVSPGLVPTEIFQAAGLSEDAARTEIARAIGTLQPLPRMGRAEDVASAVAYLASDAAAFVTGAVLAVDGGMGVGGAS